MSLDRELGNSRTGNLTGMKKQVMDLASDISDGRENVQEIYEEVDEHEEHDCEEFEIDDMDGDENTKTHTHGVDEIELDFEKLAKQWSLRDENGQYSPEKAKKMFEDAKKENPSKSAKDIVEDIDDDLNEQVRGDRGSR